MAVKSEFEEIRELLRSKADLNARLRLIPYEGTPEVKKRGKGEYLYMRRRIEGRLTSTYVDSYSEELHKLLLRNASEARDLRKQIRRIDKRLAALGFTEGELDSRVVLNLDFAVFLGLAKRYQGLSWAHLFQSGGRNLGVYGIPGAQPRRFRRMNREQRSFSRNTGGGYATKVMDGFRSL